MEAATYEAIRRAEHSWWYRGRNFAVKSALRHGGIRKGNVLDIGAGYGAMLSLLSIFGDATAYEIYNDCIDVCRTRGYKKIITTEEELFSSTEKYTLIGAFDVLEHLEDDEGFLRKIRPLCAKDARVVATVPAHQFLWSQHDTQNHHYRRYSLSSLEHLFAAAGYEVLFLSHWNFSLLPIAVLLRRVGRGGGEALSQFFLIDAFLTALLYLESLILRFIFVRFGVSLVIVARPK